MWKSRRRSTRNCEFEPRMVRKNQTRWAGFDDKILSMYSHDMSVRDVTDGVMEQARYMAEPAAGLVAISIHEAHTGPDDFRMFLDAIPNTAIITAGRARLIVIVAAVAGLRVSKVFGLRPADIDMKAQTPRGAAMVPRRPGRREERKFEAGGR